MPDGGRPPRPKHKSGINAPTETPHADPHRRRAALVCRTETGGHDRGQSRRRCLTWEQLERNANARARAFAAKGVKPGDFVAIGLPNSNAFFETTFAVWKCGATPTSLTWRLPRGEAAAVLDILKPSLVVGGQPDWNAPNSLPADFVPEGFSDEPLDNPVARYWKAMTSGGSTGRPKVILDHRPAVVGYDGPIRARHSAERLAAQSRAALSQRALHRVA